MFHNYSMSDRFRDEVIQLNCELLTLHETVVLGQFISQALVALGKCNLEDERKGLFSALRKVQRACLHALKAREKEVS